MAVATAQAGLIAHYEFEETDLRNEGRGVFGVVQESTGNQPAAKYWATDADAGYIADVVNQPGPGGSRPCGLACGSQKNLRTTAFSVSTMRKTAKPVPKGMSQWRSSSPVEPKSVCMNGA